MDQFIVNWLTLGVSAFGTGIQFHGYVKGLLSESPRRGISLGELTGRRALVGAFYHIAGSNVAFDAIDNLILTYGIDRNSALYIQHKAELLTDENDRKRFDWYYSDLQAHVRRLTEEQQIAQRFLKLVKDSRLQELLNKLMEVEQELLLIKQGGGHRTIAKIAEIISGGLAETQQSIGGSLNLSVSAIKIKDPSSIGGSYAIKSFKSSYAAKESNKPLSIIEKGPEIVGKPNVTKRKDGKSSK